MKDAGQIPIAPFYLGLCDYSCNMSLPVERVIKFRYLSYYRSTIISEKGLLLLSNRIF